MGQPGKSLGEVGSQQRIQKHKVFKLGNALVHREGKGTSRAVTGGGEGLMVRKVV